MLFHLFFKYIFYHFLNTYAFGLDRFFLCHRSHQTGLVNVDSRVSSSGPFDRICNFPMYAKIHEIGNTFMLAR
jgi:hypothetical protein